MAVAITRQDLSATEPRRKAARSRDAGAARRMLAIALVLEGRTRTEAARGSGCRARRAASYSAQFVTLYRCFGMWCRRSAFALNGNKEAPAWGRGLAPASPYLKAPRRPIPARTPRRALTAWTLPIRTNPHYVVQVAQVQVGWPEILVPNVDASSLLTRNHKHDVVR